MKRPVIFTLAALALLLRSDTASTPRPRLPDAADAAERSFDLVPGSAPLAIEISGLEHRWTEVRGSPALARFQDSVLSCAGMRAEWLPLLAGNDSALFLAPVDDGRLLVPVAILRPGDMLEAEEILSGMPGWTYQACEGRLWVAPTQWAADLIRLTSEGGARLADFLPMDEIHGRLAPGGLVRGCLNPGACTRFLRHAGRDAAPGALPLIAALLAAEFDAVRYAAFRREFHDGDLISEGVVAFDPSRLPREAARTLKPQAPPPGLPVRAVSQLRPLLAAAFRPEAQAWLPWFRHLAAHDARGPLRNLDFWLNEFQERFRADLARDLFNRVGEHGWLLVFGRENEIDAAAILEFNGDSGAQQALNDLLSWAGEQIRMGSFGTAALGIRREQYGPDTILHTSIRTPVRSLPGPGFALTRSHLVAATTPEGFALADAWIEQLGEPESREEAHAFLLVDGRELARLLDSMPGGETGGDFRCLVEAAAAFLAQSGTLRVEMTYEEDGIRFRSRMELPD